MIASERVRFENVAASRSTGSFEVVGGRASRYLLFRSIKSLRYVNTRYPDDANNYRKQKKKKRKRGKELRLVARAAIIDFDPSLLDRARNFRCSTAMPDTYRTRLIASGIINASGSNETRNARRERLRTSQVRLQCCFLSRA